MDVRLKHPFTCVISGPTGSGKTVFTKRLFTLLKGIIDPPPDKLSGGESMIPLFGVTENIKMLMTIWLVWLLKYDLWRGFQMTYFSPWIVRKETLV